MIIQWKNLNGVGKKCAYAGYAVGLLQLFQTQYQNDKIPLPPFWGGYCLSPASIEFWQGRPDRIHDRLRYRLLAKENWTIERLAP